LDFQTFKNENGKQLFEQVLEISQTWGTDENMMYVVGATRTEQLSEIREIIPNHFLLVPGVGAQGGNLQEVAKYGMNKDCGLLVNSSRGIIYAGNGTDFAEKAGNEAQKLQQQMAVILSEAGI
jgi:orotidine-5'-phosphate decarboxylase